MEEANEMEEMSPEIEKKLEEKKAALIEEERLEKKWREEIENNAEIQAYLNKFDEVSVMRFINMYLYRKYEWYIHGERAQELLEEERTRWIELAHEHLGYILQKKLFDLQCLWRADQIKLDGIEICFDFDIAERNIFNFNFPEPLTMEEVEIYIDFLSQDNLDLVDFTREPEWQKYEYMINNSSDEDEDYDLPSWYEFHFHRTNSGLHLLPDLRAPKEDFYISTRNKKEEKEEEEPAKQYEEIVKEEDEYDKRAAEIRNKYGNVFPNIWIDDEVRYSEYVNTFETEEFKEWFKAYLKIRIEDHDDGYFDDYFDEMVHERVKIPTVAHYDFKEGLMKGYSALLRKKIIEHLPIAFEQYSFKKAMGIREKEAEDYFDTYSYMRNMRREAILEGREANDEPRNMDF